MRNTIKIHKRFGMWVLTVTVYNEDSTKLLVIEKHRLIEIMDIAYMLKLHIDNENELPLTSYGKVA